MGAQKKLNWLGLPLYLWAALAVITAAGLASGKMGTDFGSTIFWLTVVGAVLMGIGNQLPIVKDYLGGGPLFPLIIGSFAAWAKIIPEAYVEAANTWMAGINFQAFFLTLLIVSSVMAIDRKVLARSLAGYLPCIFGGLIGAAVLAILVGMIFFRLSIGEILMTYVMPIMGGGSAAGALPMSAIYEEVTGNSKDVYYGIAMSALMVANVLCIFFAVGLDVLGKKIPLPHRQRQPADAGGKGKRHCCRRPKGGIPLHTGGHGQRYDDYGRRLGGGRASQQVDTAQDIWGVHSSVRLPGGGCGGS